MTHTAAAAPERAGFDAPDHAGDAARGSYLYGITRRGLDASVLADVDDGSDAAPLELLECAGLVAVARPVRLADFDPVVMQERLRSAAELEALVRRHNRVIEAVHARQAILPARFGVVYPHADDIVAGLRSACDTLLPQLHRLEGCDEWALHVRANRAVVRERVGVRNPTLGRLRAEHAAAKPGRAYFLERQMRGELEAATRQAMVALAQEAYDRIARIAVAGEVSPIKASADAAEETEILRAAFLVARADVERLEAEMQAIVDAGEGLRCECSGPWPPYSFVARDDERAG